MGVAVGGFPDDHQLLDGPVLADGDDDPSTTI
jgi:hypothetical protein